MDTDKDINGNEKTKEDETMNATATQRIGYNRLNLSTLNYTDKIITTEEALKNVTPIQWSEEVLSGEKEVIIKKQ